MIESSRDLLPQDSTIATLVTSPFGRRFRRSLQPPFFSSPFSLTQFRSIAAIKAVAHALVVRIGARGWGGDIRAGTVFFVLGSGAGAGGDVAMQPAIANEARKIELRMIVLTLKLSGGRSPSA